MRKNWISVDEVSAKPYKESVALFREYINPGLVALLDMGEYTSIQPQSAQGRD
mgnify:CR=1 FL=1